MNIHGVIGSQGGRECGYYERTTSYTHKHLFSFDPLVSADGAQAEFLLSGHFLVSSLGRDL